MPTSDDQRGDSTARHLESLIRLTWVAQWKAPKSLIVPLMP
jgi:hypothetical protein